MPRPYEIKNKEIGLVIASALLGALASKFLEIINWSVGFNSDGSMNTSLIFGIILWISLVIIFGIILLWLIKKIRFDKI